MISQHLKGFGLERALFISVERAAAERRIAAQKNLFAYASRGEIQKLKECLLLADISSPNENGFLAIHLAIQFKQTSSIEILLADSPLPKVQRSLRFQTKDRGDTALHLAIGYKIPLKTIEKLAKNSGNTDSFDFIQNRC